MRNVLLDNDSYDRWRQTYNKSIDWDETFRSGRWDYLSQIGELPRYALIAAYLHKLLGHGRVLDAGCGEGILGDYLDLERLEYVGFDLSSEAVPRAQARLRRGTVFQCRIDEFQPPDLVKYDAVVFNESLQHTETPLESLDRFRTFLTERGFIAVSLFKNPNQDANGPRLGRFLTEACVKGRYALLDHAEGVSVSHNLAWLIFVLR